MTKLLFTAAFVVLATFSASAQTKKIAAKSYGSSTIDLYSTDNFGLPSCTEAEKKEKAAKAKAERDKAKATMTTDSLSKTPNACVKPTTTEKVIENAKATPKPAAKAKSKAKPK